MTAQPHARAQAGTPAFIAALRSAAEIAARSPSSHNCQPWALAALVGSDARGAAGRLLGAGGTRQYLALAVDQDKSLGALPAHAVEMMLSCGMYWELFTEALAALGWQVTTAWHAEVPVRGAATPGAASRGLSLPEDWPPAWSPLSVAAVEPCPADPVALAALRALAGRRRTNRGGYRAVVPGAALQWLRSSQAVGADGTAAVSVRQVSDERERAAVAALVARYGGRDFGHAAAWRETHSFIRRDQADAERQGDGFTLEQLLGPMPRVGRLLTRAALAPATMRVLRAVGYPRLLATQLGHAIARSPGLVVIASRNAEPGAGDLVRAGGAIARFWLTATGHGLALHPISVVLQHDDVRQRVQQVLGLTGRAVFLARIGEPTVQVPPTPRRAPETSWRTL